MRRFSNPRDRQSWTTYEDVDRAHRRQLGRTIAFAAGDWRVSLTSRPMCPAEPLVLAVVWDWTVTHENGRCCAVGGTLGDELDLDLKRRLLRLVERLDVQLRRDC